MKGVVAISQTEPGAADVGQVVKALLASGGDKATAAEMAEVHKFSDRTVRILSKANIGALSTANSPDLIDWRIAGKQFFNMLRSQSVFMRLMVDGFRKVPLHTHVGVVATSATALARGEGQAFPVSAISLDGERLLPVDVGVIVVLTNALAKLMDADATNLIYAELRGAVAYAVDAEFFSLVIDSSTPSVESAGGDRAAMEADVKFLLEAVNTTAGAALVWAMSPDVANAATMLDTRNEMTPVGGNFYGLPAMVAQSLPAGTLRLINASAIAANVDDFEVAASKSATLQMVDNPTGTSAGADPTEATLVSMFQTNSVALLAKVFIGAHRMRADAIAEVTGVAWLETES